MTEKKYTHIEKQKGERRLVKVSDTKGDEEVFLSRSAYLDDEGNVWRWTAQKR